MNEEKRVSHRSSSNADRDYDILSSNIIKYIDMTIEAYRKKIEQREQQFSTANNGENVWEYLHSAFSGVITLFIEYRRNPYQIQDSELSERYLFGESEILEKLGYWGSEYSSTGSLEKWLRNYYGREYSLKVSKDSAVNLLLNEYRWKNEFFLQLDNMDKKQAPLAQDSVSSNLLAFAFQKLITLKALELRDRLSQSALFTFQGERYISTNSALPTSRKRSADKNYVLAVPFRQADALSDIDSIRLYEKVNQAIKKRLSHQSEVLPRREIRIASFGSFCDRPSSSAGKHNIEKVLFGDDYSYNASITYFKLMHLTSASAYFKEESRSADKSDCLEGSIYDPGFLIKVSEKYDIVCLLDQGCLYGDTSRSNDNSAVSPEKELQKAINFYNSDKGLYKIGRVSVKRYNNLYSALLRWIEYAFYGKDHQFEFDPRLYFALKAVSLKASKTSSIYTFLSRDRGEALKKVLENNNLCRFEYYNGRSLTVYDWSNNTKNIENKKELYERLLDIGQSKSSSKMAFAIRAWKMIKSLDDFYYSKEFADIIAGQRCGINREKKVGVGIDLQLFDCFKDSYVVFDYTDIRYQEGYNTVYYSVINYNEEKYDPSILEAEKMLIKAIIDLAYDKKYYEDCSSGFCRMIIKNAFIADATNIVHLVLADMISTRCMKREAVQFVYRDTSEMHRHKESVEYPADNINTEDPGIHRERQRINAAINTAITQINNDPSILDRNPWSFEIASDIIKRQLGESVDSEYFTDEKSYLILRNLGEACRLLGYDDSIIIRCIS